MILPPRGLLMAGRQCEGGENSVRRIEVGCHCWLSSWRRFHTHWERICQTRLSMGSVGTPSISVLLTIFISKHRLEAATMQIEHHHISSGEAGSGQGREKELMDQAITSHSNRSLGSGGHMSRNNDPAVVTLGGDRHLPTIKEVSAGATFRMRELLIGWQGEALLDLHQIQQSIVFAAHHEADSCNDEIHDDGPIAIQPIESNESLGRQETQCTLIGSDDAESS